MSDGTAIIEVRGLAKRFGEVQAVADADFEVREGGEDRLADLITGDTGLGMHDFTQDLARLVREGHVDIRVAYEVAPNPDALKAAIRGIASRGGAM